MVPMGGKTMSREGFLAKIGTARGYSLADDNNSGSINQREWAEFFDRVDRNGSDFGHVVPLLGHLSRAATNFRPAGLCADRRKHRKGRVGGCLRPWFLRCVGCEPRWGNRLRRVEENLHIQDQQACRIHKGSTPAANMTQTSKT